MALITHMAGMALGLFFGLSAIAAHQIIKERRARQRLEDWDTQALEHIARIKRRAKWSRW